MNDPSGGAVPIAALVTCGEALGPVAGPATCGEAPAPGTACLRPGGLELTDRIVGLAQLPGGARVLDVGCGSGATVARLADSHGLRPVGIDASLAQIARARAARPDLEFVAGRAEDLPFAAGAFEAVLAECVLSTLPDARPALREMARVVSGGGCVVLTDLYDRSGDDGGDDLRSRSTLPSLGRRKAVEALLASAGLEAETWEDHTGVLARLFWDMVVPSSAPGATGGRARGVAARSSAIGVQGVTVRPPAERVQDVTVRPLAGHAGRRPGYFACVARARDDRPATRAKGVYGARS